jgi:hypothetical protein
MVKNRIISTGIALALGSGVLLALLWALDSKPPVTFAQGPDGYSTYYVAPSCTSVPAPCYTTIQAAVDAADNPDDVIKIAAGTYTDVSARLRNDVTTSGLVTQVVYISKTVSIRGGYTITNGFADPPAPEANPTTLDALGRGRVLYITGDISPTIEGLFIAGGDADGLGGSLSGGDAGGGVFVHQARAIIINNQISDNTGRWFGGGLYLQFDSSLLSRNTVAHNTANEGAGVHLHHSAAKLSSNVVTSNTADIGGGLLLYQSAATLINNIIAKNQTSATGGAVYIENSSPRLLHTTIACNGDDSGFYVSGWGGTYSTVALTNTILVSHNVGLNVRAGNTVTLNGLLWYGNMVNYDGAGSITVTNEYSGNPAFVNSDAGNYHIGPESAAIDKGVSAGVTVDIDREPRMGIPDIGADEYVRHVYLPLVMRQ